jgi:hypothetical protein
MFGGSKKSASHQHPVNIIDPVKLIFKYKNNNRRVQYQVYIFLGNHDISDSLKKIHNRIKDMGLLETLTNLSPADLKALEGMYGVQWYRKLFISHHILATFESIRSTPSKKKDVVAKMGQPWYDTHIAPTTYIDRTLFNYQAIVKQEREFKQKLAKIDKDEDTEMELGQVPATPQSGGGEDDEDDGDVVDVSEEDEEVEEVDIDEGSEDEVIVEEDLDKNASKTAALIEEVIHNNEDEQRQKNIDLMTPFDESKNDKPYDETLKNVFTKQFVYNQFIYMDDTIKKIKQKICAAMLFSDVFNKKHKYIIPSRMYLWSEYDYLERGVQAESVKRGKLMLGQKWIVRNEILPISIEPNDNIKYYENIKGNLRSLRDNMRKYSSRIKFENDENNILEDYQEFINNKEIYMIDVYHELGLEYKTDIELVRNMYDVYIKIYFPAISNEDFSHIIDYLNNNPEQEINKILSNYQTIHTDLLLENEIVYNVEKLKQEQTCEAHSLCSYDGLFKSNYVTQTSINLNLYFQNYSVSPKIDLYRIFDNFIVNEKYPFLQYQSLDGKLVFKFFRMSAEMDKKTIMSKWFENTPFGLSFKVRVDSFKKEEERLSLDKAHAFGDKYIAINLSENGRIDYKTQWKEEDEIDFDFIKNTFKDVMDLLAKLNGENSKVKFSMPEEHHFKYAFINTIQQFTLPETFTINHNDLSDFARYFFPFISVVIDPRKRSSAQKTLDTSKYGTYLRYKRVSKFDNDAKIDHRIIHFLRNYEYVPRLLAEELSNQFNITEKEALEKIEQVRSRYPVLKKTRKVLKKFENIPKYKPPGIGIDLQGKSRDNYKIRVTGARSKEQLQRINAFIKILIYLYTEVYHYKNKKYQKLRDMLKQLTNIAKRRNRVEDIVDENKEIKSVKQITKLDKSRVGFKPEKGQNHWTRSCQNSGKKKRQPIPYNDVEELIKQGYYLNKTTGQYEKKVRLGKQEVIVKATALDDNQGGVLHWTCDTTNGNKFVHIGFLSRSQNPNGICMPCCFKKDPVMSKNQEKKAYHLKCIGKSNEGVVTRKNIGDRLYILQDTNKMLPDRFGFLPTYLDMYFNTFLNNTISLKNHYLVNTNGYFLKYGSIQEEFPFLNAIASCFDTTVSKIKENMVTSLRSDTDGRIFTFLNNGDTKTQFESVDEYVRFIETNTELTGNLVTDMLSIPGIVYPQGLNVYVFEKREGDKNDFVVGCQNTENMVFFRQPDRVNVFVLKENNNFFPIFYVRKEAPNKKTKRTNASTIKDEILIEKYFSFSNLLEHVWNYFDSNCTGISLSTNPLPIAKALIASLNPQDVSTQIVDSRNKCRYVVIKDIMLPVKPSGCMYNIPIEYDYKKYIKSLAETVAGLSRLKRKEYRPKGFIFKTRNNKDIITAISFANAVYLPVIDTPRDDLLLNELMGNQPYELVQVSLYDKIDEEIIKKEQTPVYDERSIQIATHKLRTEGYELFRLEFSNYLAVNADIKAKLLKAIESNDINQVKRFLYSVLDKTLEREFLEALQARQQGGFVRIQDDTPDVRTYRLKNNRELCASLKEDRCVANLHCAFSNNVCTFRASKDNLIEYVNKLSNELLNNDVKKKEVLNIDNYFVSDIISYDVYTKRPQQKIVKSDNNNIVKIMSQLFGKNNIPIIGKKKVQKIEKSMLEENQKNQLRRAGDKYYQNIINYNAVFRAYANGFYWRANSGANVVFRNIGYFSELQTNLSNYFRSLVFDWILDTNNKNALDVNMDEFKHQLASSKDIVALGRNELAILNRIHGVPIVIYDQYDTPLMIIDQGIREADAGAIPSDSIGIQFHLNDTFNIKKIKSLVVNKVVAVYAI